MPSPTTPDEFCSLTPTPGTDRCEALRRVLFQQPQLICDFLNYMLNADGSLSQAFRNEVFQLPPGIVQAYAGADIPDGWLWCNGQEVSRTTYANLFAKLGTVYGAGDSSTTFNLPDLQGKSIFGLSGTDVDFVLAGTGGAKAVTLTEAQIPAHNHTFGVEDDGLTTDGEVGRLRVGGGEEVDWQFNNVAAALGETRDTGGGGSHDNMPPYAAMRYLIKT